jgi:hypothetical protein
VKNRCFVFLYLLHVDHVFAVLSLSSPLPVRLGSLNSAIGHSTCSGAKSVTLSGGRFQRELTCWSHTGLRWGMVTCVLMVSVLDATISCVMSSFVSSQNHPRCVVMSAHEGGSCDVRQEKLTVSCRNVSKSTASRTQKVTYLATEYSIIPFPFLPHENITVSHQRNFFRAQTVPIKAASFRMACDHTRLSSQTTRTTGAALRQEVCHMANNPTDQYTPSNLS